VEAGCFWGNRRQVASSCTIEQLSGFQKWPVCLARCETGIRKALPRPPSVQKEGGEIINLVQYPKKCTISFANNNTFFVCQWLFRIIQQYLPVFSQKSKYVSNFCSFRCLRTYYLYNTYKTVRVRYAFVSLPFQSTFLRNYVMCTAERRVVKL